jgi:hypothetical protein
MTKDQPTLVVSFSLPKRNRHQAHGAIIKQPTHPPYKPLKPGITDRNRPLPTAEGTHPPPPALVPDRLGGPRAPPNPEDSLPDGCHLDVAVDESAAPVRETTRPERKTGLLESCIVSHCHTWSSVRKGKLEGSHSSCMCMRRGLR